VQDVHGVEDRGVRGKLRVLVCGGREYHDADGVHRVLDDLDDDPAGGIAVLVQGGALGADSLAMYWAAHRGVPFEEYEAEWKKHGRKAGPMRNKRMLYEGKPDLVVAFPGGAGTAHMVRIAREAGVRVMEVT
jgi:hypothetical protein